MTSLETALATHQFLAGLDPAYVGSLAACSRIAEFGSGQFILRQGAPAREFYLIRKGKVTVELFSGEGGPVVIRSLGEGDVLGWSWLIPPCEWRFDARAVEATEVVALDTEALKRMFHGMPAFGYEILQRFVSVIADRLEAERLQLVTLYAAHS